MSFYVSAVAYVFGALDVFRFAKLIGLGVTENKIFCSEFTVANKLTVVDNYMLSEVTVYSQLTQTHTVVSKIVRTEEPHRG